MKYLQPAENADFLNGYHISTCINCQRVVCVLIIAPNLESESWEVNLNLTTPVRVFPGWAALAILLLPAPLYGAQAGFPFAEDFQSQSFLDSTQTTARWTSSGVTSRRAQGRRVTSFSGHPVRVGGLQSGGAIDDIALRDMDGDGRLDIAYLTA